MSGRVVMTMGLFLLSVLWIPAHAEVEAEADRVAFEPTADQVRFFEGEVRPILEQNCFRCHGGGKKIRGGLRLTSRAGLLRGGDLGPAVDLESDEPPSIETSTFLEAIHYDGLQMPPTGKLTDEQIAILTRWVAMGLPWTPGADEELPEEPEPTSMITDEDRAYWAFQPIVRPKVPEMPELGPEANPIDAFLAATRNEFGIPAAPRADRRTLIRRLSYDLTGLPPTPEQVSAFEVDDSPTAYEDLVDRLLESPRYGERWARHWLDVVRFAETNSYERDRAKPFAWRYRDYVIEAFNRDKPYDRFVREQLAGDELDDADAESIIATGYYRLGIWDDEPTDRLQAKFDELDDILTTTSQTFLGITLNCARCHDHKIDPFPTTDYYRFLAFFRNIKPYAYNDDHILTEIATLEQMRDHEAEQEQLRRRIRDVDETLATLDEIIQASRPESEREALAQVKDPKRRRRALDALAPPALNGEDLNRYRALVEERRRLEDEGGIPLPRALSVREFGPQAPTTHVLIRGSAHAPGDPVEPGFPEVLGAPDPVLPTPDPNAPSTGRRRALADWIASSENPLTARVMVNRVWQYHFGRGLVGTPNNFGQLGETPLFPELLDWLTSEFIERGWRLKPLHKQIVTSQAYQMSSRPAPTALAEDPNNELFGRFSMRRLDAEEIRDSLLAVNGTLDLTMGGPGFYPIIPRAYLQGQSRPGDGWGRSSAQQRARRSVYIHIKRSLTTPILDSFDVAEPDVSCPVRFATTQPTQALNLLNSEFLNRQASLLAERIDLESGAALDAQVARALQLVTGRTPEDLEIRRGVELIEGLQDDGLDRPTARKYFCLVVLNLNEFLYLD